MVAQMDENRSISGLEVTTDGLLRLARRNARATRRTYDALAESLTGMREPDLILTDRQRFMVSQMLRQFIGDVEAAIRWHMIACLEDGKDNGVSRDVLSAGGEKDAVFHFMLKSGLLKDAELMEAVLHRLCQHQLEVVLKPSTEDRWRTDPGLDRAAEFFFPPLPERSPVYRRVAAYVVDGSRRTDSYGTPILLFGEISRTLYSRMYWRVAASLKQVAFAAPPDDPGGIDTLLEKATRDAQRQAGAIASAPTCVMEACASLDDAGLVSVETVVRLLRAGEIPLFERVFARLAGIRPVLLCRLIYEPGGEGIVVLARALGMDSDTAATIFETTRLAGKGLYLDGGDHIERFQAIFDATSRQDAERVRAYWGREHEYTTALWEAETGLTDTASHARR